MFYANLMDKRTLVLKVIPTVRTTVSELYHINLIYIYIILLLTYIYDIYAVFTKMLNNNHSDKNTHFLTIDKISLNSISIYK